MILFTQIYVNANYAEVALANGTTLTPFAAWGWRIPFLASVFLLGISLYIRLQMQESPAFKKMKEEGAQSKAPLSEAFGQWTNAKIAIVALLGLVAGQAVVWYTGQFYALFFLQSILKVDQFTANVLIAWSLTLGTGGFLFFGWLSDRIGRKSIILAGCLIAAVSYFPLFKLMTATANPALYAAQENTKVVVYADPADCSFQFNPTGTAKFTNSCDIAKSTLARSSVNYTTEAAPPGTVARIKIGSTEVQAYDAAKLDNGAAKTTAAAFNKDIGAALGKAGYPGASNPSIVKIADRAEGWVVELRQDVRHLERAEADHHRHPDHPGAVRHHGVRADCGSPRRALPDTHPLLGAVAALSHRQRLVRRTAAGDLLRHGGAVGRYLLRALVSDRHCRRHGHHRVVVRTRNPQARHLQELAFVAHATEACNSESPLRRAFSFHGSMTR